jgi:2-C-methyl-D-erythritol 4-phosphate cytidylyltransferase
MPDEYVIITAGGKGARMGADLPKQFLELAGLPVIMHAISAFSNYSSDINMILVLPDDGMDEWNRILGKYPLKAAFQLCGGGETRFHSVKNGLKMIAGDGLVAIHDAARPLVSTELISRCFREAALHGNAVPVIPMQDSMRELNGAINRPANRDVYRLVQTPQVFDVALIRKAYGQAYRLSFTDDATVAEASGAQIHLVEGERRNIKITTAEDLAVAEALGPHSLPHP